MPPIWITLELRPDQARSQLQRFMLVTFDIAGPQDLASPRWRGMADEELARLVGSQVSRDRGVGFQPWQGEPDPVPVYQVGWTILLPRPRGMNRGCIRNAQPLWKRLARQVTPRREVRDCCYYHRIDWHRVSAAAILIVRQARLEGLPGNALSAQAGELAEAQGLCSAEEEALADLLSSYSGIQPDPRVSFGRRSYTNGRHRTTAMLDSGVRRTVVIRWRYPGVSSASSRLR